MQSYPRDIIWEEVEHPLCIQRPPYAPMCNDRPPVGGHPSEVFMGWLGNIPCLLVDPLLKITSRWTWREGVGYASHSPPAPILLAIDLGVFLEILLHTPFYAKQLIHTP